MAPPSTITCVDSAKLGPSKYFVYIHVTGYMDGEHSTRSVRVSCRHLLSKVIELLLSAGMLLFFLCPRSQSSRIKPNSTQLLSESNHKPFSNLILKSVSLLWFNSAFFFLWVLFLFLPSLFLLFSFQDQMQLNSEILQDWFRSTSNFVVFFCWICPFSSFAFFSCSFIQFSPDNFNCPFVPCSSFFSFLHHQGVINQG